MRTVFHFFDSGSANASTYIYIERGGSSKFHRALYAICGADSLFIQDIIHPHVAQWILKILRGSWNCTIWVANLQAILGPNWTHLGHGRQMHPRWYSPVNFFNVLRTALQEEWEVIPQENVLTWLRAVIWARGSNTHY